jgi:hypothetical protein
MHLSDILRARGLASVSDINDARERQREHGGRLGDNLIAMGVITNEQLTEVVGATPAMPRSVEDTGIARSLLLNLLLKFIRLQSCETIPELSRCLRLPHIIVAELLDEAMSQKLVHVLGSISSGLVRHMRYALSEHGRIASTAAMEQSMYMGPAPVNMAAFQAQVNRQRITNETMNLAALESCFAGLVLTENFVRKLAPAIACGRTVLLYGPPGNGKTSIGTRIASLFRDPVFIPHAIEVGGQIIKMFDPALHTRFMEEADDAEEAQWASVQIEGFDQRWVVCRRPVAVVGGEMTLDMLELHWDASARCYDAPMHMKALNGIFMIDDFGRQKVGPTELLNRLIVPLENRIDYLKLNTGNSFSLPFDELVLFSTNLEPADLMDPAFLRRIHYKIKVPGPNRAEFRQIFDAVAAGSGLTLSDDVFNHAVHLLTRGDQFHLASFQPKFICDQAVQACKCFSLPRVLSIELLTEALENLYVGITERRALGSARPAGPAIPRTLAATAASSGQDNMVQIGKSGPRPVLLTAAGMRRRATDVAARPDPGRNSTRQEMVLPSGQVAMQTRLRHPA